MPRVGILNIVVGFSLLLLAASAGAFVALDTTYRFLHGESQPSWRAVLEASSHGHTALFGVIQILFGLTLSMSQTTKILKVYQSVFLACGAIAMGPGMMIRAALGPTTTYEWNGVLIGGLLSLWMLALAAHIVGLIMKLIKA